MSGLLISNIKTEITNVKIEPSDETKKNPSITSCSFQKQSYLEFVKRMQFKCFRKRDHPNESSATLNNDTTQKMVIKTDSSIVVKTENTVVKTENTVVKTEHTSQVSSDDEVETSSDERKRKHPSRRLEKERFLCDESESKTFNRRLKRRGLTCNTFKCEYPTMQLKVKGCDIEKPGRNQLNRKPKVERLDNNTYGRKRQNKGLHGESIEYETPAKKPRLVNRKNLVVAVVKHLGLCVTRRKGRKGSNTHKEGPRQLGTPTLLDLDAPSRSDDKSGGNKSCLNYERLLREFVVHKKEEVETEGQTLYEKRVCDLLRDPALIDFYIPPAQVEVIFQKTASERTAEETLRKICEFRKWPEPVVNIKCSGKVGFFASCTVKTLSIRTKKPASNEDLARELAFVAWLEWLGLDFPNLASARANTYF
ncbi:uncharacterized protein LOC128988486 [Macrosteles quadrilineatus]|uniref:uncharacterized protein LOC128988486 n=1 Tax=Macrosteles quadrilineatus TaxID=74068 RepID=UPI0023E29629|nr:uncharacterized protein LOC128988486 [Macrosteles quadrilineatus]